MVSRFNIRKRWIAAVGKFVAGITMWSLVEYNWNDEWSLEFWVVCRRSCHHHGVHLSSTNNATTAADTCYRQTYWLTCIVQLVASTIYANFSPEIRFWTVNDCIRWRDFNPGIPKNKSRDPGQLLQSQIFMGLKKNQLSSSRWIIQ